MEIVANSFISTKAKRIIENGIEYLIAPVTMIVPGVLAGSKGPLYYPPTEVSDNPSKWNGTPLVKNHPFKDNGWVTVDYPGVLEESGLGEVRNARVNQKGNLVAEAWFDVLKTSQVDYRIILDLEAGRQIELSTGLLTTNKKLKKPKKDKKGREYEWVATNYRPDHLAILPDQKGACSIEDGCGVLVNRDLTYTEIWAEASEIHNEDKPANCSCLYPAIKVRNGSGHMPECNCHLQWVERFKSGMMVGNTSLNWCQASELVEDNNSMAIKLKNKADKELVDNLTSHKDIKEALCDALCEMYPPFNGNGQYIGTPYIEDIYDDFFVFEMGEDYFKLGYSVTEDGMVEVSQDDPQPVRKVVDYVTANSSNTFITGDNSMKLTSQQRNQIIEDLTTNCDCWKHQGDKEVLNSFTDEKLVSLKQGLDKHKQVEAVANAAVQGFRDGTQAFRVNPETGKWETATVQEPKGKSKTGHKVEAPVSNTSDDDDSEYEDEDEQPRRKVTNTKKVEPVRKARTIEEFIKQAPSHLKDQLESKLQWASQIEMREKDAIINKLLVNVSDSTERQTQREILLRRTPEELQFDLARMPKVPTADELAKATGKSVNNQKKVRKPHEEDVLVAPTINWNEVGDKAVVRQDVSHVEEYVDNLEDMADEDEALRNLPSHIRSRVQAAMSIESRERKRLIDELTANLGEEDEVRLRKRLENKSIEELKDLATLSPRKDSIRPSYFGAATPVTTNRVDTSDNDVLLPPTINWREEAKNVH